MTTQHKFDVTVTTESDAPLTREQEESVLRLLLQCGLMSRHELDTDGLRVTRFRIQIPDTDRVSECTFGERQDSCVTV